MRKLSVLLLILILLVSNVSAEDCAERVTFPGPIAQWAMALTTDGSFTTQSGPTGQSESFTSSSYGVSDSAWADDSDCDSNTKNPVGEYWLGNAKAEAVLRGVAHNAMHQVVVATFSTGVGFAIYDFKDVSPVSFVKFKILPLSGTATPNGAKTDKDGNYVVVGHTSSNDVFIMSVDVAEDKSITVNWAKTFNYLAGSENLDTGGVQIVDDYIAVLIDSATSGKVSLLVVDSATGAIKNGMSWGYVNPVVAGYNGNIGVASDDAFKLNIHFDASILGVNKPQFISATISAGGLISEVYSLTGNPSMTGVEVIQSGSAATPENGDNVAIVNGYDPSGLNPAYGIYSIESDGDISYGGYTILSKGYTCAASVDGNYLAIASQDPSGNYQVGVVDVTTGIYRWSDTESQDIIIYDVSYSDGKVYLAGEYTSQHEPFVAIYDASTGLNIEKALITWSDASGKPAKGTGIAGIYANNREWYILDSEGSFGIQIYGLGGANVPEFSLTTLLLAVLLAGGLVLFVVRRRR